MKPNSFSLASLGSFARFAMVIVCAALISGCRAEQATLSRCGAGGGRIQGTVAQYGYRDNQMVLVVWSDCNHIPISGGGNKGLHSDHDGTMTGPEGRRVSWKCETPDGKTGTVTINGAKYDLAKGSVFLVSTKGADSGVVQLQRDLSHLPVGESGLEKLAKDHADIAAFVARAAKP